MFGEVSSGEASCGQVISNPPKPAFPGSKKTTTLPKSQPEEARPKPEEARPSIDALKAGFEAEKRIVRALETDTVSEKYAEFTKRLQGLVETALETERKISALGLTPEDPLPAASREKVRNILELIDAVKNRKLRIDENAKTLKTDIDHLQHTQVHTHLFGVSMHVYGCVHACMYGYTHTHTDTEL